MRLVSSKTCFETTVRCRQNYDKLWFSTTVTQVMIFNLCAQITGLYHSYLAFINYLKK